MKLLLFKLCGAHMYRCPCVLLLGILFPLILYAESDFQYFTEPALDYWKQSMLSKQTNTSRSAQTEKTIEPNSKKSPTTFQWGKYLSPTNDEFFREGDYTPPAPFMEIARNPTDNNIENWFHYLKLKNNILKRLQSKLSEYTAKNPQHISLPSPYSEGMATDPMAMNRAVARVENPQALATNTHQFRLRLYFDSHCPHCEKMMGTVRELMQLGYWVELRQVDSDTKARAKIPFPVADAPKKELESYKIESVPVLLVGDLRAKTYFKIQGYQTSGDVLRALNDADTKGKGQI